MESPGVIIPDFRKLEIGTCVGWTDEKYIATDDGDVYISPGASVTFLGMTGPHESHISFGVAGVSDRVIVNANPYNDGKWVVQDKSECEKIKSVWVSALRRRPRIKVAEYKDMIFVFRNLVSEK